MALAELPAQLGTDEVALLVQNLAVPVALTGATGFVGSHVLDALRLGGVARRVLVRRASTPARVGGGDEMIVPGCLEDSESLRVLVRTARTVIHMAGVVRAGRAEDFRRANAAGTSRLVAATAAESPGARLIYVSSLAAAGPSDSPSGRTPEQTPAPVSAYGRSKLAGEEAVRGWSGEWVILRPPAVYGPRDQDVLQFFKLTARGVVPLPAGERWVTVAHVADVVRGILLAGREGEGRVFHLGEPQPSRMDQLIATLARAGGLPAPRLVPVPAVLLRAAGLVGDLLQTLGARSLAMTSDKATELLARHWTAATTSSLMGLNAKGYVPFETGAQATWAWYRQHGWVSRGTIRVA